jgi:hypothetical protein
MYWLLLMSAVAGADTPAPPQATTAAAGAAEEGDDAVARLSGVEVVARRGAAKTPPETELSPSDIEALNAYDIGEALDRIGAAYGMTDPPVVIINGRRVQNPGDYMGFPPDALSRVELLPEQAAGLYGADPGRRVVNLVLQRKFQSRDAQVTQARPTAGGRVSQMADIRRSAISNQDMSQLGLRLTHDTSLRADERPEYLRDNPDSQGVTLKPRNASVSTNVVLNRGLGEWQGSFSATARAQRDASTTRRDEELVNLRGRQQGVTANVGANGEIKGWSVRAALDGQLSGGQQQGIVDRKSETRSVALNLSTNRSLFTLPTGQLTTDLSGRVSHTSSTNTLDGISTERSIDSADVRGGLSIPLLGAPQAADTPGRIKLGTALMSVSGSLRRQTGSGGGQSVNGALSWAPTKTLRVNGSWARAYDAPSNQQLFDAPYYGEPIVVFDFVTGQSVEILPLYGGNPDLKGQTNERFSISLSAGPFTTWKLAGAVNYRTSETRDGVSSLPGITPAVEAAFPERFLRDADGRLTGIDQRSINLVSASSDALASNLNFVLPLGPPAASPASAGSLRFALNHTLQLKSTTLIRSGYPIMDRLAGDGGGASRNELSATVDARQGKWTLNASGRWRQAYRTRRDVGVDGADDLLIAEMVKVDLKLGYTFAAVVRPPAPTGDPKGAKPLVSGLRLGLEIENLFDARPKATRGDGRPAPGYGRYDQDSLGRIARVTLRGRF